MSSTYSTNLAIELIGTGDQAGTWGTTTNSNLGTLIEQSISGYVTQAVSTGTDTTITIPNGSSGVARNMYIELTGTGGASTNLIVPANKKLYFIFNNSSGAVTVKVSGQTGVSVPTGKKMVLVSNGTDIVNGLNYIADFASNSATITHLSATSATITNLTLTSLVISNLSIASANITTLTSASATITNLLATSLAVSSIATFAAGSAAAPSITTTGDTNTGLFFPAADTIGFTEGGVEAARFNSSGVFTTTNDATIQGLTVGRGAGAVATNTAVGASALAANSTGSSIVAVGDRALNSNTGDNNTALGALAGYSNTTGTENAFLGRAAGFANTTGGSNTAVGNLALNANTTASNNTAVGYQAGYSGTTGANNVYVGLQAGYSNTTSSQNTFVGQGAGYFTTGADNTYFGRDAGTSSTTGASNTFIGRSSGEAITTGGKNSILGRYTGNQGGLDIRTASNYIVLSDGDGNPRAVQNGTNGTWAFTISTAVTSVSGTTATLAQNATADIVDLASIPGLYQVSVRNSDGGINWRNSSQVFFNGVSSSSIITSDSANVTVTMSGTNIRLTNTSATSIALYYAILRLL